MIRTDTVNVRLNGVRHLEVDHKADILYINAAAGQVCRDENVRFSIAQGLE